MARRSRQMFIVLALAVSAILLALSVPVAVHAATDDGTGSEPPPAGGEAPIPKPLDPQVSQNPVVFGPLQNTRRSR